MKTDNTFLSERGVEYVSNPELRDALRCAYLSPAGIKAKRSVVILLTRLTFAPWTPEIRARFMNGWYATHGTALYVSGLMIRENRAAQNGGAAAYLHYKVASEIGEVIPEDTGVDDIPHHELFANLATRIVGDDRWKLDRYLVPACDRLRADLKQRRLSGPIEDAILITAASESWNTGEYGCFDDHLARWMVQKLGHTEPGAHEATAYVRHHTGDTELRHFIHMLNAWDLYCQATGIRSDPSKARRLFEWYLNEIGNVFGELVRVFAE